MRRWLTLLMGIVTIAVAGTALALAGSSETDVKDPGIEEPVNVDTTYEKVEFEPIPDGMLVEDVIPQAVKEHEETVDQTPPVVEILHPENGQVFKTREVVFEGITELGTRVFFGDREADVSENGAWRIVLHLDWGEHVVTAVAVDDHENAAEDSVTLVVKEPEKPKPEPKEEPKEEPREEPKEEHPKEEVGEWEFSAHQLYGECSEEPPYDVFWGTGKPGSAIIVESKFSRKVTEVNDHGEWEVKVVFEGAPIGEPFVVHVADKFGNLAEFEFLRTG